MASTLLIRISCLLFLIKNLDLRFLLFYCLFMLIFFFLSILHVSPFCVSVFIAFFLFLFGFFLSPFLFSLLFVSVFRLLWVSSLAYPNPWD
jgi:hypothetical protein